MKEMDRMQSGTGKISDSDESIGDISYSEDEQEEGSQSDGLESGQFGEEDSQKDEDSDGFFSGEDNLEDVDMADD